MTDTMLTFAGNAATILRALKNAKPFAAPDIEWSPPVLVGIHIRADDGALVVEATDRYVLLVQSIDASIRTPGSAIIPLECVDDVVSVLKTAGKAGTATMTVTESTTHQTLTVETGTHSFTTPLRNGTFPTTSTVLNPTSKPWPVDEQPVVGLNPYMLALLGKVKTTDPSGPWMFTLHGPLNIVIAKPLDERERITFGQMPVRIDNDAKASAA
jgi:hypothetical protein